MTIKVSQVTKRRITVTVRVSAAFSDCQENLWLYCQVAALEVLNDFWLQKAVLSAFVWALAAVFCVPFETFFLCLFTW